MSGDYDVFIDEEACEAAWKTDSAKWKIYLAKLYSKKGVKHLAAAAVNHFTFSVGGFIFEAPAAHKTSNHLKHLREIETSTTYPCSCVVVKCSESLEYVIGQKKKKESNTIVGMLPVIGTLASVKNKIHALTKTDRGAQREKHAKTLQAAARGAAATGTTESRACSKARATIAELLGSYRSQDSWKLMFAVCEDADGWKIIKSKLSAT